MDRRTDGPTDGPTKRGVESRSTRLKSRAKRSFTFIDGSSWKKKRLTFRSLERSEKSLTAKLKETLDVLKQREEKHKRSDQELRDKLKVRAQCGRIVAASETALLRFHFNVKFSV